MKILNNVQMSNYTTIKIGGIVRNMYIPENTDELKKIIEEIGTDNLFGGGSNLLVSDEHIFDNVINLREFNNNILDQGNGKFKVGASVRLQKLINVVNASGYGGIEYLYSVPGLVGGAVIMNAGGGIKEGNSISDYIYSVTVLYKNELINLTKDECLFSHRSSLFKENKEYVVVSVDFKFIEQDLGKSKEKIHDRLELTKRIHDLAHPNFGSVFCVYNPKIVNIIKKIQRKHDSGVWFSDKTDNWLVNCGGGTYKEAIMRINHIKKIHRMFHCECETEVIIWD